MTGKYNRGDHWFAKDANLVLDLARQFAGTPLELLNSQVGDVIFLGKMAEDISFGETKTANLWTSDETPPTDASEVVEVTFDYFPGDTITAGKQIAWVKFGDINRLMWAECPDPEDPQSAQIQSNGTVDTSTGIFEPIPGGTTSWSTIKGVTPVPDEFGYTVQEPGWYSLAFTFSAEAQANNSTVQIRSVGPSGPAAATTWEVKAGPGSVSGTYSALVAVTQADIDGGVVYIQVERNINNTTTWLLAEINISRSGKAIPV